jgi:hypothetical protein
MSEFTNVISHNIYQYKKILKRHLQPDDFSDKIKSLGINRITLRSKTEVDLYKISKMIYADLDNYRKKSENPMQLFSGVTKFREHLKSVLNSYRLESNKVINANIEATHSIATILQMVSLYQNENPSDYLQKLTPHVKKVLQYANPEQISSLTAALNQYQGANNKLSKSILRILSAEKKTIN